VANSLLTIDMITREALRLFKNSNAFLQQVDRQYDDQFAQTGAKIGDTLRIRLPNDYVVRTGAAASVQDTNEQNTTLTLATQKGVDMAFTSRDRALDLDDYSTRIIAPAINNLAGDIALDLMTGSNGGAANLVANLSGATLLSPNAQTFLEAGALLDMQSSPRGNRKIVEDPFTEARVVTSLSGLFNPQPKISEQYATGQIKQALGFDWMMDQSVLKHTSGSFSSGTVNGANQTGVTLTVNAITGTLVDGDIITLAGVNAVNRVQKQDQGVLRQFVVLADVANGGTSISIYPAIVPPVGGQNVQYQTVTASPANGAAIDLVMPASTDYRQNLAFVPEAVTFVTADLELFEGTIEAFREEYDSISMRMISQYGIGTDQAITRLDVLYGYAWLRPEWVCIVPDVVP
jgi:hypothetical protein